MSIPQLPADSETIRQTAREILQRPEYKVDELTQSGASLFELFLQVLYWLFRPLVWLFDALDGIPEAFRWLIVIGLALLLIALIAHIIYTFASVFRGPQKKSLFQSDARGRAKTPEEFERMAQHALSESDYIGAVRHLFRAGLLHLQSREEKVFRPGLTNREYLRRYQQSPLFDSLSMFVEIIDTRWYGKGACREEDYLQCRAAYTEIQRQVGVEG